MIAFFTEPWTRRHDYTLGAWALSVASVAVLSLFTIASGILLAAGVITMTLSLIAIPLLILKSIQTVYAWVFPPNIISEPAQSYASIDGMESNPISDNRESFDFYPPALNQNENTLDDGILNSEKSYLYSNGRTIGSPDIQLSSLNGLIKAYTDARAENSSLNLHICILGMGSTGLIAGLRAYARGASITLIDSRSAYTRKNVLRLSQDFLMDIDDLQSDYNNTPHSLMRTIFLSNSQEKREEMMRDLMRLVPLVPKTNNMDTVFREENTEFFHTVETNVFEQLLYAVLESLRSVDPSHIAIFRGVRISNINASMGEVEINEGAVPIKADWLVNATGVSGRLANPGQTTILDTLFPPTDKANYTLKSPAATYLAATFVGGLKSITHLNSRKVPHSLSIGAARASTIYPAHANKISMRLSAYTSRRLSSQRQLNKNDLLHEQRVFYGYLSRDDYFNNPLQFMANNRGMNREDMNIDLACSYYGVVDSLQKMREFGWKKGRLPLIRQLNASLTTYVGMEIPTALFNELTSDDLVQEVKDRRFKAWLKVAFEQFFDQDAITKLGSSLERGSAFSVQMRVCNKIMHEYSSGVQVFNLGDVLVPPHFLTGSGLESAALSVHYWIDYIQHRNKNNYIQTIQTNVQQRSIDKVNVGLRQLGLFNGSRSYQNSFEPTIAAESIIPAL